MKLNDIVCRIGTAVRIRDSRNYIDGLYKLTAVIIRKNEKEYFYQAEVQQLFDDKAVLYVRPEMIELI